jgi:hypothetical protein
VIARSTRNRISVLILVGTVLAVSSYLLRSTTEAPDLETRSAIETPSAPRAAESTPPGFTRPSEPGSARRGEPIAGAVTPDPDDTVPAPRVEFVTLRSNEDSENPVTDSGRLVDGERDGLWVTRLPDGVVWTTTEYRKGKRHGTVTFYDRLGRVEKTVEYADDLEHGPHRAYFPDGRTGLEFEMVHGRIEGELRNWHDNGQLRERSTWLAGERNGPCTYWTREGEVLEAPSGIYEAGKKVAPHDPANS